MASSTCVKCGSGIFEMKLAEPRNSTYRLNFIQCSSCGGVVGVLEFKNITATLEKQNKAIQAIAQKAGVYVDLS